ncbi:MAG: hypothetical protein JRC57_06375 [Deltaproteobacteria bacterium]|nr:hypothetical protein [Deltaproteobacteria bacterium]
MSYSERTKQKKRYGYFLFFILFFVSYGYFFQGGGWNQNIRICLTRAIIHHGTFTVDRFKEDSKEMEFVNAGNWAFYNGHYYSNKSPGLSFLAVPSFALAEYCLKHLLPNDPEQQVLFSAYFSNLCTTVLMSSLLCLLIFHVFHHFFQMSIRDSFLLMLFYGFGTIAFSYSTTFYCHQPAAFCSFLSFVLVMHIRKDNFQKKGIVALLAGFSAASAVLIEPSALFILAAVSLYLVSFKEGRRCFPSFILGGIPIGMVLGWYNFVCFGHPLASSYNYANEMVMFKVDGRLFGIPSFAQLNWLLLSPYRGLLFLSPVFLMVLPGMVFFLKKKEWRAEAVTSVCISLCFIFFIAGFYGIVTATPPRYLLPAFPFFFLLAGLSLCKYPKLFKIVGVISILINLSITLVGIEIPWRLRVPLVLVAFKNIIAGKISINPVPISHFNSYPSIYELANIETWTPNFNSFNLGEIAFPHSVASIVPLVCFWIIWGYWWRKKMLKR